MKFEHARRSFLKALGAGAAGLPFFRLLEHSAVHAQTGDAPQRFITLFHPHGAASPLFRRRAEDTETAFELNFTESRSGAQSVLAPFDDAETYGISFKDRIVVLDGIDLVTGAAGHDAPGSLLTGSAMNNTNASLDQYLAVDLGLGADTRFTSLVLGVGNKTTQYNESLSFGAGGGALPKVIDPQETFNTVFADLIAAQDPEAEAAAERARLEGRSVLDFIRTDIEAIHPRLGPEEAWKLDQHLTSLRELEKRLQAFDGACQLPSAPPAFERTQRYNGGEPNFNAITDLQLDLLAQAVACDLTRFATVWMNELSSGGINGTGIVHPDYNDAVDVHNAIAHTYQAPENGNAGDPTSWERLGVQNRYSYGKAARFMQRLNEYGVLDDTLIFMSTDMGNPSGHSSYNTPMLLLGGASGKLTMGRFIQLKENCPPDDYWCGDLIELIPHNRVLVSIANLFGANIDAWGNPTDPTDAAGDLSELAG